MIVKIVQEKFFPNFELSFNEAIIIKNAKCEKIFSLLTICKHVSKQCLTAAKHNCNFLKNFFLFQLRMELLKLKSSQQHLRVSTLACISWPTHTTKTTILSSTPETTMGDGPNTR